MSFVNVKEYNKLVARVTELEARLQAMETFHKEGNGEKKVEVIPDIVEAIEEEENLPVPGSNPLEDLFGTKIALLLIDAEFDSLEKVGAASDERLQAISGIGAATVATIRELLEE